MRSPASDLGGRDVWCEISLLHLSGVPWARIGEAVGQRSLRVTSDTYTHVLVDEAELDYFALVASEER